MNTFLRVFKFYETLKIPKSQGMCIINTGVFIEYIFKGYVELLNALF